MKNILKAIIIAALTFTLQTSMAQGVTSLYFLDNLPQANMLNPALEPNYAVYIGLPIINNINISLSSDIGLNDVYNSNGQYFWNSVEAYDDFVNNLNPTSYISTEFNTSLLNFGFLFGKNNYLHVAYNLRYDMTMGVPQDFFKTNDLTINHDLSTLSMETRVYTELAIGYSRSFLKDNLVVGVRAKYLCGIVNASMGFETFNLNTQTESWDIAIKGSMDISSPVGITVDEDGIPSGINSIDTDEIINDAINYALLNSGNSGFGFDFGVEYQVIPKLKISASITDLGSINWKSDVTNYNVDGQYSFTGMEDLVSSGDDGVSMDEDAIENFVDTLLTVVKTEETNNTFSNSLYPKLYLAAEYELTESISFGALYKSTFYKNGTKQNITLNANANLKRFLTFGVNYNIGLKGMQNSYGGVLGLRLTPFYIYLASDVVPGYAKDGTTFINGDETTSIPITLPNNFSAFNFQFGINIELGERRIKAAKSKSEEDVVF